MGEPHVAAVVTRHDIHVEEPVTHWSSGLAVGNGVFGAVSWQPSDRFEWAVNHLEVSQGLAAMRENPTEADSSAALPRDANGAPIIHARVLPMMNEGQWEELDALYGNPFVVRQEPDRPGVEMSCYPLYPVAAWLRLWPAISKREMLQAAASGGPFLQRLDLLSSRVVTRIPTLDGGAELRTLVAPDMNVMVVVVEGPGAKAAVSRIGLHRPGIEPHTEVRDVAARVEESGNAELHLRHRYQNGFHYAVAVRVCGGLWQLESAEGQPVLRLRQLTGQRLVIALAVSTSNDEGDPLERASALAGQCGESALESLETTNRRSWLDFWSRSVIETGDDFLDSLWYINLHALAISNARGHRFPRQACGLTGILAATDRTKWGNAWVLDVNIQEAYSPAYATNHTELAAAFHDGVAALAPAARELARAFFGMEGLCFAWPWYYASYYHCAGPWYALYLWWQWEYTRDTSFLRERAFPIMKGVCEFLARYIQEGPDGRYGIWPSISPENAARREPAYSGFSIVTRNPAIDLSLLRHLFSTAADAAELLGEPGALSGQWRRISTRIADYSLAASPRGTVMADSESDCPPAEVQLRHASRLMPVWPAGQIGLDAGPPEREIAEATVRDTADRAEIVTHSFGWVAAAAARLGRGDLARQHLLDAGCGPMLRSNGLFAESTERLQQYCSVDGQPVAHPPLLEAGSSTAAAITEMLLQSHGGRIRVFPALPYPRGTARFAGLRAMGAHLISAETVDGVARWIEIESLAGEPVTVVNPWWPAQRIEAREEGSSDAEAAGEEMVSFPTHVGGKYLLLPEPRRTASPAPVMDPTRTLGVRSVRNSHGQRLWIGKSHDSQVQTSVESFIGRTWIGNQLQGKHCPYRFDFGTGVLPGAKGLSAWLPPTNREIDIPVALVVTPRTDYHANRGFGWRGAAPKAAETDRAGFPLLRDCHTDRGDAEFAIDLQPGLYELLFVVGHPAEESWSRITLSTGARWSAEASLLPGRFETPILSTHQVEESTLGIRLSIVGEGRVPWSLAGLFVRMVV